MRQIHQLSWPPVAGAPVPGLSDHKPDDAFWDDDSDYAAPLVAPGVAILAFKQTVAQSQAVWDALAPEVRARLVACITGGLRPISLRHQEIEAQIKVGPEHQVPVAPTILRCLDDLIMLSEVFAEGGAAIAPMGPMIAGAAPATPEKKVCTYCNTTFYVDIEDTRCPACGANS